MDSLESLKEATKDSHTVFAMTNCKGHDLPSLKLHPLTTKTHRLGKG